MFAPALGVERRNEYVSTEADVHSRRASSSTPRSLLLPMLPSMRRLQKLEKEGIKSTAPRHKSSSFLYSLWETGMEGSTQAEKASCKMNTSTSRNACKSSRRKLTKLKSDSLWKEMGAEVPPSQRKLYFVLNVLLQGKHLNNEKIYVWLVIFKNQVFFF